MNFDSNQSRILENAIDEFSKLPGVGRKTATRLIMHLIRQPKSDIRIMGESVIRLANEIKYCSCCHNISDSDVCNICSDPNRDSQTICVVESIKDVISVENTHQYRGQYHVLGGIISPVNGIGPDDLNIDSLEKKIAGGSYKEVIFALSTTMEGDTTNYYIFKRLCRFDITFSTLARGVSIGDELEYIDEITLGRSILNRTPFEMSFSR